MWAVCIKLLSIEEIIYFAKTNRVSGLLGKNLSKLDHVGVIVEGLCKVNHVIRSILLLAWTGSSQKCAEGRDSNLVTFGTSTSSILG
jgi:hypothetical protein